MQSYEFIDIHTHKIYADGTIFIFSRSLWCDPEPPAGTLFSAGVHPWNAAEEDVCAALEYLNAAPISAVGEIGLDYASDVDRSVQRKVFEVQLEVAQRRLLPTIIHCVRAHNDILSILKLYDLPTVIFHGFIGSPEQAVEVVRRGYYLSFNERSLASPKTVESLCKMPVGAIFAETDASQDNVSVVYDKIARVRNMSVDDLKTAIADNFNRIFL